MRQQGIGRYHEGAANWSPSETVRARITGYHTAFALARRPQVGWQALAQMLQVNELDLRRACGDLAAQAVCAPAPTPPQPAKAAVRQLADHSQLAGTLLILAAGVRSGVVVARQLGRTQARVQQIVRELHNKGLITASWTLTDAGKAEAARLRAARARWEDAAR